MIAKKGNFVSGPRFSAVLPNPLLPNPLLTSALLGRLALGTLGLYSLIAPIGYAQTAPASASAPVSAVVDTAQQTAAGNFLVEEASAYARFQTSLDALRTNAMASNDDLNRAFASVAGQEIPNVGRGWLAFSALIASRNPEFAAAVRKEAELYTREHMLKVFASASPYVRKLAGADAAAQAVLAAAKGDAGRIAVQGNRFFRLGYDLQASSWGKGRDSGDSIRAQISTARVSNASGSGSTATANNSLIGTLGGQLFSAFSTSPTAISFWDHISASKQETAQLTSYSLATKQSTGLQVNPARENTMNAILSLAAFSILEGDPKNAAPLLAERASTQCFRDEDDGFKQCVTAMTERFSRSACIGNHALGGTPHPGDEGHGLRRCVAGLVR